MCGRCLSTISSAPTFPSSSSPIATTRVKVSLGAMSPQTQNTTNFRFVVFCLWMWLAVCRTTHASLEDEESPAQLRLAPERLLPRGGGVQCAILLWRKNSHLRPSYYRGRALIPTHFWLLLLAGDVEVNWS